MRILVLTGKRIHHSQVEFLPFYPVPEGHIYTDATSVGIPKSSLWKAFQHARLLFFDTLQSSPPSPASSSALIAASTVLLLHDSEHLTAINTRKRLLLSAFPPASPAAGSAAAVTAPRPQSSQGQGHPQHANDPLITPFTELTFLTSLLTSPLHRHTKSPHLWAHRRWLLTTYPSLIRPVSPTASAEIAAKAARKWARKEISTLLRAAEAHPKNYYAWTYARWMASVQNVHFIHEDLVGWCIKHTGDVSGWSFLSWLWMTERDRYRYLTSPAASAGQGSSADARMAMEYRDTQAQRYNQLLRVVKYSHEIAPGHESLWRFVGAILTQGILSCDHAMLIIEMLRTWDRQEWPTRVADDIVQERMFLRELMRDLDARAAGMHVRAEDAEMVDRPP
ncbi:hypothetical protein TWF696_009547 [Orbilia brochopaga]|uniref:Protein prenylyltransferase n=1 Tax=Orbilia brochopaga TaxID=3140254 RepID=A0AAV9UF99_9PEZI